MTCMSLSYVCISVSAWEQEGGMEGRNEENAPAESLREVGLPISPQ